MKTSNEFQKVVYGYWAKRFDCERENFVHSGTLVRKEEELAGTGKMHLYQIDKMSILRADPRLAEQAGLQGGYNRDSGPLSAAQLQALLPVESASMLLDHFLDAQDFQRFVANDDFVTRQLDGEKDNQHLLSLYEVCTEEELDEAAINLEEPDPVIFGMFDGEKLAAYASHRYWEDVIADIGVLIHPDYRGKGLGKAVVSSLCEWCLANDVIPMYRVFSYHTLSRRIPLALGFKELVTVETLKLTKQENAG